MRKLFGKFPPDWLLIALLALGVFLWQRSTFPLWMVDLFPNQLGAHFWKSGQPEWMYTPLHKNSDWVQARRPAAEALGADGDPNTFMYPPLVAALLSPISDLPAAWWRNTLFVINLFLLPVLALQIRALSGAGRTGRSFLWSLALVLATYPVARAIKLGQITPLLFAAFWAAMLWLRRNREIPGALLAGFISAVKVFPLAAVAIPVLLKRTRAAAWWIGTVIAIYAASLTLLGFRVHGLWWEVMREFSGLVQPFFGNQSPLAWFARVVYQRPMIDVIPFTTPLLDALKIVFLTVFLGGTLAVLWGTRASWQSHRSTLGLGLLLAGLHLALPVMWEHYWIILLPPLAWAIRETWMHGDRPFWLAWLVAAVFFFTMKLTRFYGDDLFGQLASGSQSLGMLLFWVWLVRRALRGSAAA
ncbi:MAG: glycosyltransferase family 87 protein [bacterium]|nr:glycosyltransferase family 87 protein [bacterium]